MTSSSKHRNNPPDQFYQRIEQSFNVNPGNPLPRLKKRSTKPFMLKRAYQRARR